MRLIVSKQILIVDDEPYIQMLVKHILQELEDQGVEILTADNGQQALEVIQNVRPHLVFLDLMMPQMNGFVVCQTVKKDLKLEGVFIVIVSGRTQEFDRQYGFEVGADQYLSKPFDPEEIIKTAIEVLGLNAPD